MTKRFARCYIHCGIEKTGTTSIQSFIAANRDALRQRGLFAPTSLGVPNNTRVVMYARADEKDDAFGRHLLQGFADHDDFRKALRSEFAKEVGGYGEERASLLISCELIHSQLTSVAELRRLHDFLTPYSDEIRPIVYLRRQDRVATSLFSTSMLLGGTNWDNVFLSTKGQLPRYYDYRTLVLQLAEIFGQSRLIIRLFEMERWPQGSLVLDFARLIGLTPEDRFSIPPPQNESLDPAALRFLCELNKRVPHLIDGAPNPLRMNLGAVLQASFPGEGPIVARREAMEFYEAFRPGNAWVRQNYFPHLSRPWLFDEDFERYPEAPTDQDCTFEKAARFAAALWEAQSQALIACRKRGA